MEKEPVPNEIKEQLNKWNIQARLLRATYSILGLSVIIASVMTGAGWVQEKVALLAAIATGALTYYKLETRSDNMRNAWRMLNTAVLRYKTEEDFTIKELNEAYIKGEETIGNVNPK